MVCPKCGNVLLEGEICPCSVNDIARRSIELMMEEQERLDEEERIRQEKEAIANERRQRNSEAATNFKNMTADISGNLIQDIIAILKTPKTGIKEFIIENNMVNAIILMALQAVIFGILAVTVVSSSLYGVIGGLLGFGAGKKFLLWLLITISSLVASAGNTAGFMLTTKMQRHSKDFIYCLNYSAPKAVLVAPLTVISLILMVINGYLGLVFLFITFIAGIATDSVVFSLFNKDEENTSYCLLMVEGITAIISFAMIAFTFNLLF